MKTFIKAAAAVLLGGLTFTSIGCPDNEDGAGRGRRGQETSGTSGTTSGTSGGTSGSTGGTAGTSGSTGGTSGTSGGTSHY